MKCWIWRDGCLIVTVKQLIQRVNCGVHVCNRLSSCFMCGFVLTTPNRTVVSVDTKTLRCFVSGRFQISVLAEVSECDIKKAEIKHQTRQTTRLFTKLTVVGFSDCCILIIDFSCQVLILKTITTFQMWRVSTPSNGFFQTNRIEFWQNLETLKISIFCQNRQSREEAVPALVTLCPRRSLLSNKLYHTQGMCVCLCVCVGGGGCYFRPP